MHTSIVQSGQFYRSVRLWLVFLLLALMPCEYAAAEDGQFKFSSGVDYSSGKYDDTKRTTILYIPYRASYKKGPYEGKIACSWISIDGPGSVIDGVVVPGTSNRTSRESGIGDTWISLTYDIEAFPYEWGYLDVTGKLKIPTADEDKGLGTGEYDQAVQFDYMYPLGRLTPMLALAYKKRGDPDGVNLKNSVYVSVGADWRQTEALNIGASLDYQQASVKGLDDPLDLFTYLSYKVNDLVSLTPYLYFGLSEGSPDVGGGVQVTLKPN